MNLNDFDDPDHQPVKVFNYPIKYLNIDWMDWMDTSIYGQIPASLFPSASAVFCALY